jgi:hypothetical protein
MTDTNDAPDWEQLFDALDCIEALTLDTDDDPA